MTAKRICWLRTLLPFDFGMRGSCMPARFVLSEPYRGSTWKSRLNGAVCFSSPPWCRSSPFGRRRRQQQQQQQFRAASTFLPDLPIFRAITSHDPSSASIVNRESDPFTYANLVSDVLQVQKKLERFAAGAPDTLNIKRLEGRPIAFLADHGYDYVVTLLAILASDAIALPLSTDFPAGELSYILDDSQTGMLLATEKHAKKAQELLLNRKLLLDSERQNPQGYVPRSGKPAWKTPDVLPDKDRGDGPVLNIIEKITAGGAAAEDVGLQGIRDPQGGMMLYTSGTTDRPKGVFLPHSALSAQMDSLVKAWSYSPNDHLLHLLPLHHIHGIVTAILTPLFAGSSIEFMFPFIPYHVWNRIASPFLQLRQPMPPITFLTAVPTIYKQLLSEHPILPTDIQRAARTAISPAYMRLNISGSAALPTPTKADWSDLSSGNALLERYGMTEVGMALSCGVGFADRVDGSVGWPLPSVEVRLVDTDTNEVVNAGEEIGPDGCERMGEIQIRGPTVFKEYWRNPDATAEEFVDDADGKGSWFKTGDLAVRRNVEGAGQSQQDWARGPMYFIQGRKSVDIIKRAGEKVSALEVERELVSLPQVDEAAVLGVPSKIIGEKVVAVLVLNNQFANTGGPYRKAWGLSDMRRALKKSLALFKIPREIKVVLGALPKNAMGKVNKKQLAEKMFGSKV